MRQFVNRLLALGLFLSGLCAGAPAAEVLTNHDVVEMVKSGLSEAIIKEKILASENLFDVSAKALIELKKEEVPETLIQLIHQEALKNLKKLRARIASEIQNLASDNENSRRGAIVFLKKADTAALPQLREAMNANEPAVRVAIVEMLGRMGDRESAPALREALGDSDRRLRIAAAEALGRMKDATALELSRQTIKQEAEPMDAYVHYLGCVRDAASAGTLAVRLLKAFPPETRAEAAWALGEAGTAANAAALEDALLHDREVMVKKNAAEALGKIASPESFDKLADACRNLPAVRTEVLTAIGRYPARLSVPFLVAALPQPMKPAEKEATMKALRRLTGRDFGADVAAWNRWMEENAALFRDPAAPEKDPGAVPGKADAPAAPAPTAPTTGNAPAAPVAEAAPMEPAILVPQEAPAANDGGLGRGDGDGAAENQRHAGRGRGARLLRPARGVFAEHHRRQALRAPDGRRRQRRDERQPLGRRRRGVREPRPRRGRVAGGYGGKLSRRPPAQGLAIADGRPRRGRAGIAFAGEPPPA
ncbi:MAG: HEAT repeat domain-containing protein [Planctomycetes bacterium]|nr:HEAT repeat domain-containing protein [Planctomycetota bacterium]